MMIHKQQIKFYFANWFVLRLIRFAPKNMRGNLLIWCVQVMADTLKWKIQKETGSFKA